jgi:uncharacterized protein (DUF433 family)
MGYDLENQYRLQALGTTSKSQTGDFKMNTLYSKIDSRRIPIYSIQDAASYLRIPASTIRSWTIGHRYPVKSGSNFFAPLIEISQSKPYLLSFTNLVEIHVLRAIRQHHKIQLNRVRNALDFIDERFQVAHPLATQAFSTDGVDLFIDRYGELIQASQLERNQLKLAINTHLERIEPDDSGLAIKLYPFTRSHEENNPRIVVVDSRIAFGRLTIDGTGIATSILKERYAAGDSIDELAMDYDCNRLWIEEAIRCELSTIAA